MPYPEFCNVADLKGSVMTNAFITNAARFNNLASAEKHVAYHGFAMIGGSCLMDILGCLFEDKFVFTWALGICDEDGNAIATADHPSVEHNAQWMEQYTIRKETKAWERLKSVIKNFAENENFNDVCLNNWLDMASSIIEGTYLASFDWAHKEFCYSISEEVQRACVDVSPSWDEMREKAQSLYPSEMEKITPKADENLEWYGVLCEALHTIWYDGDPEWDLPYVGEE